MTTKERAGPFPGEDIEVGTMPERVDVGSGWGQGRDIVGEFLAQGNRRFAMAKMIAEGGLTAHKSPAQVMTIMLAAMEMGVPLMQALRGMYVVKGKLALEGHLMDGLAIGRCGVSKTIVERSERRCEIVLHRPRWDSYPSVYTLDDAARAGIILKLNKDVDPWTYESPKGEGGKLLKETWLKHPKQMLYWRALSDGLKVIAPDFFGGMYHVDELSSVAEEIQTTRSEGARRDLKALMTGVEPDQDLFTDDEMTKFSDEIGEAERSGVLKKERAEEMRKDIINGDWREMRDGWAEVRSLLLDNVDPETMMKKGETPPTEEKPAEQGKLL